MPAFSQAASGTIVGTVTDESGAAIPDVSITLRNTETGFSRSVSTNSLDQYVVAAIPTGTYSVAAEKTGFGRLLRDGFQLSAADTATVNLALRLGDLKQTVKVTGSTPLLEAQNADVSKFIDNRRIVEMPLNGRTFTALRLLTPGAHVGSSGNPGNEVSCSMRGSVNYSVNRASAQDNSYVIDGMVHRNLWLNTLIMVPTIDSIQEFRVMTSNYSAEYGSSAGAVMICPNEIQHKSSARHRL